MGIGTAGNIHLNKQLQLGFIPENSDCVVLLTKKNTYSEGMADTVTALNCFS